MKGLFIKDFSYIKESKLLFLILVLFGFGSSYFYKKPTFVLGYFSVFPGIILMSTISYDSINHGFTSLFTLPIKKEDYLKQKYSLGILLGLLFLFFAICISSIGYYRIQQSFHFLNSDFLQGCDCDHNSCRSLLWSSKKSTCNDHCFWWYLLICSSNLFSYKIHWFWFRNNYWFTYRKSFIYYNTCNCYIHIHL